MNKGKHMQQASHQAGMFRHLEAWRRQLSRGGTVSEYTNQHSYFGFHRVSGGWVFREWAPDARQIFLTGEFNGWDLESHPMLPVGNGSWVLYLPGEKSLWEDCRVKTVIETGADR